MIKKILRRYDSLSIPVKASIWFFISSVLQKGITVISTPIFTRWLSTAEYGEYSIFNSWLDMLGVFVTLRLYWGVYSQGLVKFDEKRPVFQSSIKGLFCSMVFMWLIIYLVGNSFWNKITGLTTLEMLAMFILIWATGIFNFWAAEQKVDYKYKSLVAVTLVVSFLKPVAGIFVVQMATKKVLARVWELAAVELLCYGWIFVLELSKKQKLFDKGIWKYALSFNLPLLPHYLAQAVLYASDKIMIERMVTTEKAGIYALACSLAKLMLLVNTALQQTMNPWLYKNIKQKKWDCIHKPVYLAIVGVTIANLLLIFIAPEAVRIFAPPEYYEAIWAIPPIALGCVFVFEYNMFSEFEFYYEKTKLISISTIAAAALNLILNVVFIRIYGYLAAGYTTLICYILYAALHYVMIGRIMKEKENGQVVFKVRVVLLISFVAVILGLSAMFLYSLTIIRYLILIAMSIVIFINRKRISRIVSIFFNR